MFTGLGFGFCLMFVLAGGASGFSVICFPWAWTSLRTAPCVLQALSAKIHRQRTGAMLMWWGGLWGWGKAFCDFRLLWAVALCFHTCVLAF